MDTHEITRTFVGEEADLVKLNNWIFDIIYPYIKGNTLELGSSKGGISSLFIERDMPIHLSDADNVNREKLRKRFEGMSTMRMIFDIDFTDYSFEKKYADKAGIFSTLVAVNIAEHGAYSRDMLHNAKYLLRERGHFMIVTNSKAALFSKAVFNLEDLQQYNYKVAKDLMGDTFEVLKVRYFNLTPGAQILNFEYSGLHTLAIYRKKNSL